MAPEPRCAHALRAAAFVLAALVCASPAHALRILDYNVLNYPGNSAPARNPLFRTVLGPIAPDVMVAEEMTSQVGTDLFLSDVLNTLEPGQWAAAPFEPFNGNDTDCALYWKPSKFDFLGQWAFYPNPANLLRYVHVYRVRPVGYASGATEIRFYALHLKASTGSTNVNQRLAEATGLRDSMNAVPPGSHCFAVGDFNFYTGTEPGLGKLLELQADNDGRLYDILGLQGVTWQDNASIAFRHTQSPCLSGGTACASGASTGGLDDRFDLILPTYNWNDGTGYEAIADSLIPVGNDGQHLNKNITDAPTIHEGAAYADALIHVSDHLPLRLDIQVPARISLAGGPLVFPTVIQSAPLPSLDVQITNVAPFTPADGLTYSFTGTAGFQVPAGTFELVAGAPAATHSIRMGTGSTGNKVGTATIASDDLDQPSTVIDLSGTVLRHASPSLDATTVMVSDSVDFGAQPAGAFADQGVDVYDQAYDALQARLSLDSALLTGGDGRFSIVGGFSPSLLDASPASFALHFDDAGATLDQDYQATLTFGSSDEALPGGTTLTPLSVALHSKVVSGSVATPNAGLPTATRLFPAAPNPLVSTTTLRFDLARAAPARLELFDLSGRHVATLASGSFEAGRYAFRWDGRDAGVRAEAGVYFARLVVKGLDPQTVRFAVVR